MSMRIAWNKGQWISRLWKPWARGYKPPWATSCGWFRTEPFPKITSAFSTSWMMKALSGPWTVAGTQAAARGTSTPIQWRMPAGGMRAARFSPAILDHLPLWQFDSMNLGPFETLKKVTEGLFCFINYDMMCAEIAMARRLRLPCSAPDMHGVELPRVCLWQVSAYMSAKKKRIGALCWRTLKSRIRYSLKTIQGAVVVMAWCTNLGREL